MRTGFLGQSCASAAVPGRLTAPIATTAIAAMRHETDATVRATTNLRITTNIQALQNSTPQHVPPASRHRNLTKM
jgi:hypothetical protein